MIRFWYLVWLPVVTCAAPAYAHSPTPGIEGFYVGILHPFSTPSQVLLMVGLGTLAGGFTSEKLRYYLLFFSIFSLVGLIAAPSITELDATMFAVALCACTIAALMPGKIISLTVALIGFGGLLVGVASIPDDGPLRDRLFTMFGSFCGANLGLLYIAGTILVIREHSARKWIRIAFRIVAAWLGAVSLLMLGLETTSGMRS